MNHLAYRLFFRSNGTFKIDKRILVAVSNILAVGLTLMLTYLSVGKSNTLVLPAIAGVLMLTICFLSIKTALIVLVMSMLLSPEIGVGSTAKRDITIRFDDILLFIITVGWIMRMAVLKDIGFMRKNPLNRPIFAFCFFAILSTSIGILRGNVNILSGMFFVLKLIEYFFLFYMVINYVETEKDIKLFIGVLLLVCGIVCGYALWQVAGGGDVAAPFEGSRGERNTLGGYLVLIASITGGILFYHNKETKTSALVFLLFAIITTLLFSLSRSGWSGLIVSYTALFIIARKIRQFIIIVAIIAPVTPFLIPKEAKERFEYTFNESYAAHRQQITVFGIQLDGSSSARIRSYGVVLSEISKHLFLGYGITGFSFIDGQFFRVLSEMGVVGLSVFIWLLVAVYRCAQTTRTLPVPETFKGLIVGFQAGFWGIIMHALTANTFIIIRIAEPFWFFFGLVMVIHLNYRDNTRFPLPGNNNGVLPKNATMHPVPPNNLLQQGARLHDT